METTSRTPVPVITDDERRMALEKATARRMERSNMLHAVKQGQMTVAEFIGCADDGNETARATRAFNLIKSAPGVGFATAQRIMREAKVSSGRCVRGLGKRQRERVIELCEAMAR